jgi:hypothetical protein
VDLWRSRWIADARVRVSQVLRGLRAIDRWLVYHDR